MNPLETEVLKYEKKGYKTEQKRALKYGSRTLLLKKHGIFTNDEGVYIYYVDGNATTDNLRECFKEYVKFYEDFNDTDKKGFFLVSGSVDEKLFKDLRKALITKENIRNSIKAIILEKAIEEEVTQEKKSNKEVKESQHQKKDEELLSKAMKY